MRPVRLRESLLVATSDQWLAGARPRTLPAAIAPVLAGTGVAAYLDASVWWKALLALVVSVALQVGVNYANDYSDGIRGTDAERVGPMRLVGSGVAQPAEVKRAALLSLGVACVAGLVLALTTSYWLVLIGAVCVAAAWFYTGGKQPYGYHALGEVMVFVFFGLVAVVGTTFVQTGTLPLASWYAGAGVGALACAILVANNLRDVPTDREAGKRTLAVLLGDEQTRFLFAFLVGLAAIMPARDRARDEPVGAGRLRLPDPRDASVAPGARRCRRPRSGAGAAGGGRRRAGLRRRDLPGPGHRLSGSRHAPVAANSSRVLVYGATSMPWAESQPSS